MKAQIELTYFVSITCEIIEVYTVPVPIKYSAKSTSDHKDRKYDI